MTDADINLLDASRRKKTIGGDDDEDEAFHFIAYIPISDSLWELDGLKRQPVRLGITSPFPFSSSFQISING